MKKLRLGFYPYAYARVTVMKSDLIPKNMWQQYLKMGPQEILRNIADGTYKEITEVANTQDIAALEIALNKNMMNAFKKLHRISDEKLQQVVKLYAQRYDIENVKTIIRGKIAGIPNDEIEKILLPSLNHPPSFFTELIKKEKPQDIISVFPVEVKDDTFFAYEHALDRYYVDMLVELSSALRGQGKAFRSFIDAEVTILNLKIIMRLLQEKMKADEIVRLLIQPSHDVLSLARSSNVDEFAGQLFKRKMIDMVPSDDICTELEIALDVALLKKESLLMHQHPLTVNVMLGFMLLKEIEVKNLKVVLKGKLLGLPAKQIEQLVVVHRDFVSGTSLGFASEAS